MGLLLVMIMLINMIIALVVVPLLVWFFKPKFLDYEDLLVGEGVDISRYSDSKDQSTLTVQHA